MVPVRSSENLLFFILLLSFSRYSLSCMYKSTEYYKYTDGEISMTEPILISTWHFGLRPNEAGVAILQSGGTSLDAAEAVARSAESDRSIRSVGYGGYPDRTGRITLDASIMTHEGRCGAVAALEHIEHPISVARAVMERTPHSMLVGEGAYNFAREIGHPHKQLLTVEAQKSYEEWLESQSPAPKHVDQENHDTISILALDSAGRLAGCCSTSGLAWKMHGRVGDSPIIGAGLYVNGRVGAAAATGHGELAMRSLAAFRTVELMRQGYSPLDAAKECICHVIEEIPEATGLQLAVLALSPDGAWGGCSTLPGFQIAVYSGGENRLHATKNYPFDAFEE